MKQEKKAFVWWSAGGLGVLLLLALDQWTKYLAVSHLAGQEDIQLIPGVLSLHYLENRGAAFGLLQGRQEVFVILCVLFLIFVGYTYHRLPKNRRFFLLNVLAVVVTAGALGNFIDRVRLNYVIDFIYFSLIDFPVFNVADIYVTVSAAALVIAIIFVYKDEDFTFLERRQKGRE